MMGHGSEIDRLVAVLKAEAATAMPPKKQREFGLFLERLSPLQRQLPFGRNQ